VYYCGETLRADGSVVAGRWRATFVAEDGKRRSVSAPTRAEAERRREERLAATATRPIVGSRFTKTTTVEQLTMWWLESVARHQVRTSTLDSYRKFGAYLCEELGPLRVIDVGPETLTTWQSRLLDRFAPFTVLNCRKVCRQAFNEAVKVGLIAAIPLDVVRAPPARRVNAGRALTPEEARRLIVATEQIRLSAAVTLLFCQGWRVSEVLGLAWEDLDLDVGTAQVRRAASYTPSVGTTLGPTKTSGAEGVHHLAPIAIERLRQRLDEQNRERRASGTTWPQHKHDGRPITPVFTTLAGQLVNRQKINKLIERGAELAGLEPAGLASHTGRRTVITALYAYGGVDIADVARHVGHTDTSTTADYVRSLGQRPAATARIAASLLDPTASRPT
jgi:integrase